MPELALRNGTAKQPGSRSAKYAAAWAMLALVQQCRTSGSAGTCAGMLAGIPDGIEVSAGVASKSVSAELVASFAWAAGATASCCDVLLSLRRLRIGLTAVVFLFLAAGWAGVGCKVLSESEVSLAFCVV